MPEQSSFFDGEQSLPQGLRYEPEFLSRAEEQTLVAAIESLPLREAKFREYFARRRVAHYHRDEIDPAQRDGGADSFSSGPLPAFLAELGHKVAAHLGWDAEGFVHALVSEYRPATPIGWHRDKPTYGIVVGVSLAGPGEMRFRPIAAKDARHTLSLTLAPRSLYVMRDSIRWEWQHSMLPTKALRYSITLRTDAVRLAEEGVGTG